MKYANLWASCACLLLLKLEMGAARATASGPSESLYTLARDLGLDAAGLEYIWRTKMPWVIRTERGPDDVTTVTYTLGSDRRTITKREEWKFRKSFQLRENSGTTDPEIFLNPFLNPFGTGSSQAFFENWASTLLNPFLTYNPKNPSTPPSNRIPNERVPNEHKPSIRPHIERPEYTPNTDESNSNDSQWVPVPEDTNHALFVPLPTRAPSNNT